MRQLFETILIATVLGSFMVDARPDATRAKCVFKGEKEDG